MSVTSAARVISASAAPKRMADNVFMLHGATTMPSWRKNRWRSPALVVTYVHLGGHGCDLAGDGAGLLQYRYPIQAQRLRMMALGAKSRVPRADAVNCARSTCYCHYDPHLRSGARAEGFQMPFPQILQPRLPSSATLDASARSCSRATATKAHFQAGFRSSLALAGFRAVHFIPVDFGGSRGILDSVYERVLRRDMC